LFSGRNILSKVERLPHIRVLMGT